jgi:NAD(P)-dependent dehydrogenase (short-subunit alcohol dehydrogenase family)
MKTIIITGATGSIGNATARAFAQKENVQLVLVGRNNEKLHQLKAELASKETPVEVVTADLGDVPSVKSAVEAISGKFPAVDAIVNIAAVYKAQKTLTRQRLEMMLATNHLGPFALTNGLMKQLKDSPGSKVLTVSAPSSTRLDFSNWNSTVNFSAFSVFGGTKMMNLLFAFSLARQFEGSAHASMAFHPGLVKSELLTEGPGFLKGLLKVISSKPDKTANAIVRLIMEGSVAEQNGKFYNNSMKPLKAAKHAYDEHIQKQLWKKSEESLAV